MDNGPGIDLRTISNLTPAIFSYNDLGQVGFYARFVGGSEGLFVSNIAASADFDGDGDVDGRDLLVWQRGGSPGPLSAGNLALWQEQFGMANGSLSASAMQIPEPGTAALIVVFAIAFGCERLRSLK